MTATINELKQSSQVNNVFPLWLKTQAPTPKDSAAIKEILKTDGLHTVCQAAACPNIGVCWRNKTATFMILGDTCTRACRFCNVATGFPRAINPTEPKAVADAVRRLNLKYVVITSVTRDDLDDGGAQQFIDTITAVRAKNPETKIEVLIPDFSGDIQWIQKLIDAKPDVVAHNLETVNRLSRTIRPQAEYRRSLNVLRHIKEYAPEMAVKSGFMVGLGELFLEVVALIEDIRRSGCDILTIGQYLSPQTSTRHCAVHRFYSDEEFLVLKRIAEGLQFIYVTSGPLVRSSFMAEEGYKQFIQSEKEYFRKGTNDTCTKN